MLKHCNYKNNIALICSVPFFFMNGHKRKMPKDVLIGNTCFTVPVIRCGDFYDHYYFENPKNTHKKVFFYMSGASSVSTCFCVILCVGFYMGHFVMVSLNLTYLHSLQHPFFEHLFNVYYI